MNAISHDVCCLIAQNLNDVDRVALALTCKRFYIILKERNFLPRVVKTGYEERSNVIYKNLFHASPFFFDRGLIIRVVCAALLSLGLYCFERNMLPTAPFLKAILDAEFKNRSEFWYGAITIISPTPNLYWDITSMHPAIPLFSIVANHIYREVMKGYEYMETQANFLIKVKPNKIMRNYNELILRDKKQFFNFFLVFQVTLFSLGLILYDRTLHPRKLMVKFISDGRICKEMFESKWIQEAIPNNTLNEIILRIGIVAIPFFSILNAFKRF